MVEYKSNTLAEQIRNDYKQHGASITSIVTFSSGDLHYAIGSAEYTASVAQVGNILHVTGVLKDMAKKQITLRLTQTVSTLLRTTDWHYMFLSAD